MNIRPSDRDRNSLYVTVRGSEIINTGQLNIRGFGEKFSAMRGLAVTMAGGHQKVESLTGTARVDGFGGNAKAFANGFRLLTDP